MSVILKIFIMLLLEMNSVHCSDNGAVHELRRQNTLAQSLPAAACRRRYALVRLTGFAGLESENGFDLEEALPVGPAPRS
jgi:hypothetical protein